MPLNPLNIYADKLEELAEKLSKQRAVVSGMYMANSFGRNPADAVEFESQVIIEESLLDALEVEYQHTLRRYADEEKNYPT